MYIYHMAYKSNMYIYIYIHTYVYTHVYVHAYVSEQYRYGTEWTMYKHGKR